MKRILSFSTIFIAILVLTVACGGNKSRPLMESVSAFLNENENIIGFGSAKIGDILAKADYENEPKIKAFLNEPLGQLQSSINMDVPVYFAIEGPLLNGNPSAVYLFLEIKDKVKLKENLEKNGFDIQENKAFDFVQDGDMNLSFDEKLAVVVVKSNVDQPKEMLAAVRKQTQGDVSTGKTASILNQNGDIVYGSSLTTLFATSNTDLNNLSAEKQVELKTLLKDGFVESSVRFENGELIVETKNHFSEALKNKLFFRKDSGAKILDNLGNGTPRVGVSMNIDTKKLQEFLNEYAPNAMADLSREIGGAFAMAMMVANNDISKLIDGRVGALVVGDATKVVEGMIPDFNFFVGLAGQGKTFGESIKTAAADKFKVVTLTDSGIAGFTNPEFAGKGIQLSEAANGFGQNAFDLFIDLDGLDLAEMQLDGGAKMVEIIKSIKVQYNADGGKVVIKAKEGKENILKQAFSKVLNVFEDQIAL